MDVVMLDDRIAVYVLFPIFLAVTLVSVLRQNLAAAVRTPRSPDLQRVQIKCVSTGHATSSWEDSHPNPTCDGPVMPVL